MRRKDREVSEFSKIIEIIDQCHICRLGFCDGEEVYIVPLNFGYESKEEKITFYFHSAKEGRKIELIKKGMPVGFEMDTNYHLHGGPLACDYTAAFDSVIGNGTIHLV
ncbi:MAG: pyridoxamine 5'-phosphate oxidase family protein, partial [Erysipelotrichaceae bacterium]